MSLRRLAPRFVDWRLSRIDEEVDRVSCSSDGTTPPSPPLPPPPPLLLDDDFNAEDETLPGPCVPSTDSNDPGTVVYSNANEWRKQQLQRSAADDEREALRFIKEKYDSLGKIIVEKRSSASPTAQPQTGSTVHSAEDPTAAVYENVPPGCAHRLPETDVAVTAADAPAATEGASRKILAECAVCSTPLTADHRTTKSTPQRTQCCSRPAESAHHPEPVQRQRQHPQCQCHHRHQQQEELQKQRQRAMGECIPRSPLSDGELIQIDLFYRSYKSSVYVCTCMATLSFSRPVLMAPAKSKSRPKVIEDYDDGVWACVRTGIPVIVRDSGDGKRRRRVCVLLAERGTGFELWRAPLDRMSDYAVTSGGNPSGTVSCSQHTMRLSVDDTVSVTARLAFDDQPGADEFHRQLVRLSTAADDDAAATTAGGGQSKKKRRQKGSTSTISKCDISQPCCFSHVTRLERGLPCRGRTGLHIVVASGRQLPPAVGPSTTSANSTHPTSTTLRTTGNCQSSFKANHV